MHPQFMQSRAAVLVAVLTATIVLSACGSKPDSDDIRKQLVSGIQCNKFIIKDVKKIDGAEAPNKQYEVAYTFVAEIKGGKSAAAAFLSKWMSLDTEAKRIDRDERESREQEDNYVGSKAQRIGILGDQIVKLKDCASLGAFYWPEQLFEQAKQNIAGAQGPIPIPYAIEFQGTGFMRKTESGWVFTGNSGIPQTGKTIQSEPLKFDRPKPPIPALASKAAAPASSPTGVLAATRQVGDVTPVEQQPQSQGQTQAASATTLETLVSALALSASATYPANDWSSTNTMTAVTWSHKGFRETRAAPFTRLGRAKLEGLGGVGVFYSGVQTMVRQLDVQISEADGHLLEKEEFMPVLKTQFRTASIKAIRAGCKDEGAVAGSAVFEVVLPGKKPVFVLVSTDSGGNSPNSRSSSFQFSLEQEARWKCSA